MKNARPRSWVKGNGRHFIAFVMAGAVMVDGGAAVAWPFLGGQRDPAPVPADQGPTARVARPASSGETSGLFPTLPNLRTGIKTSGTAEGSEDEEPPFLGGERLNSEVTFAPPGDFTQELEKGKGDSEIRYAKSFEKTFSTEGFLALASAKLIDPAAGEAVAQAIDHGLAFKMERREDERSGAGGAGEGGGITPYERQVRQALNNCIRKKMEGSNSMTRVEASNQCQKDQLFKMGDHPQAPQEGGGGGPTGGADGAADGSILRLSTLLFEVDKDRVEVTTLPDGDGAATPEKVIESYRLTAEEFRRKFGDVEMKGEVVNNRVKQSVRFVSPWESYDKDEPIDPQEYKTALSDPTQLNKLCEKPVSLDFARYCWAFHFYNTIQWTVKAQCDFFNESAELPKAHLPTIPRGGQGSALSLTGADEQPGPWGVNRKDWERVAADLSFPGYTFGVKTAEAFFYGYRKEAIRLGAGVKSPFDIFGSLFSSILGGAGSNADPELKIDCSGVGRAQSDFTFVAQNWNRIRFPTFISAAARFANARALLFSRDIVISAWAVIQQYTSSMGYKDLGESARRLLTAAYDSNKEVMVQKELEKVAKTLEKLELEYEMARTQRGGNASTSAR